MSAVAYYVCDRCGHLWRQPPEPQECHACGRTALWEFPTPDQARMHAQTVKAKEAQAAR